MFIFNIDEKKYKKIHFIGIGGISMSGLAEILNESGYSVSGSDANKSDLLTKLANDGIDIHIGHKKENIYGADLVIYTDAISLDNEELREAIKEKIDIVDRASFLGALMKNYKISMAISGTHGKTTTTSMVSEIIRNLPERPTILLGGKLDDINGNVLVGNREIMLTEACEYKANVLKYFPTTAVILNIDEDHLDFFDNMEHIVNTFKGYVDNLKPGSTLILNIDDPYVRELQNRDNTTVVTFGVENDADYTAKNIKFCEDGYPEYDLYYKGSLVGKVILSVLGLFRQYGTYCKYF